MNWISLSLISCALWGISAITASMAVKRTDSFSVMLYYSVAMLVVSLFGSLLFGKQSVSASSATTLAIASGATSAVAISIQFLTFSKWQSKLPYIVFIGALYPMIVLLFSLVQGNRLTGRQLLGTLCAVLAIWLFSAK